MECKLYKEDENKYIYAVNRAFYLVIPKIRNNPNIEVVLDSNIKDKLEEYTKTSNIGVIRVFAKNYFTDISDEISRYKLKSIINSDISVVRQILDNNKIKYSDIVYINTPFQEFKDWYITENTRQDTYKRISQDKAKYEYQNSSDTITENQRKINELLELRDEYLQPKDTNQTSTKGKQKLLSNGHSLLNYNFDDGFVNVVFLSLVTIIVSISSILFMLNAIIK